MPPRSTKRETTTNLKTKSNKKCHIIELHGSPTTNEIKKKHSSRLVGGAETGIRGGWRRLVGRRWQVDRASPRLCTVNQEEQLGSERDHITQGFSVGK